MHFGLTPEQEMVVSTVRGFVETRAVSARGGGGAARARCRDEMARDIREKVIALGFYAANFPAELGGGGLDTLTFTLLERELGRAALALAVHFGRPSNILMACRGEQREHYLLPAIRGEKIDALAMTEPDAGSDVRSMKTTARPRRRRLGAERHKAFHQPCRRGGFLHRLRRDRRGGDGGRRGRSASPAFWSTATRRASKSARATIGLASRLSATRSWSSTNAGCRQAQVLGEVHRGFDVMNEWLSGTRLTVAATCVGRARRAFDLALGYAATRKQFGQPIGKFQGVSFKLADMVTEIDAADWLTLAAAWRRRPGARGDARDFLRQALCQRDAGARRPTRRSRSMAAWG